jgi:hypothetical protein
MAKITVDELREEGRFTTGEFDWDNWSDPANVDTWLGQIVTRASIRVQQAVGATNYASADTVTTGSLKDAELQLALSLAYRRVVRILSSRPEEAPPPPYVDLSVFVGLMETHMADFETLVAPYRTDSTRTPGLAFGFTSTGVDETELDDYSEIDYGSLEASA